MKIEKVKGKNKGKIMLYALSTCVWCKKTKKFLDELGVEYSYVYVDNLEEDEKNKAIKEIEKWNPRCSFPTIVFNDEKCVVGYKEDEIKEALKYEF
ncbi:MAG: glutaredoxin family protein [Candidatus Thermoplasmatota archaeon]|nr:glutaredoxin family protein [Candidatus Thermoplasmatota archaeon]